MEVIKIIQLVSVLISLIAPVFFFNIIRLGIVNSNFETKQKSKFNALTFAGISLWVGIVYVLTLNDVFAFNTDEAFPKFLLGLFIPVTLFALFFLNKNFRVVVDNISLKFLAIGQIWRVLGAIFFLVATSGIGPKEFIGSGFGDVATGAMAILSVWAINKRAKWSKTSLWGLVAFGTLDLLIVLFILLTNYPLWSDAIPSTASAGSFPMMLIIGIAAPMALLLHVLMLRKLVLSKKIKTISN